MIKKSGQHLFYHAEFRRNQESLLIFKKLPSLATLHEKNQSLSGFRTSKAANIRIFAEYLGPAFFLMHWPGFSLTLFTTIFGFLARRAAPNCIDI